MTSGGRSPFGFGAPDAGIAATTASSTGAPAASRTVTSSVAARGAPVE